jgi:putative glycosyltransferase (TIGR04372 family)
LETLQSLYERKKQLVFVGREKVPACFRDFSVIPYSESPLAHFEHDIALFQNCEMAIIGGSGISFLADCYNKPYLYINSWHVAQPIYYPFSIVVPTLLQKKTGELASFEEQIALFLTTQPDGRVENLHRYKARNASSDEILAALYELEQLIGNPSPETKLQQTIRQLGKHLPLEFSASRISEAFLNKHRHLLASGS